MIFDTGLRFNRERKRLYQQFFLQQDLTACRAISYLVIAVMLLLIVLDFFRVPDMSWVLFSRLMVCVTFSVLILLTYKVPFAPLTLQLTLFTINVIFISSLFLMDVKATMPQFFLTNSIVTYMFIAVTISGLWFRFGALLNFSVIGIFFLYLPFSRYPTYHATQRVNLLISLMISLLIGFIWERHKRGLFLQHTQMNKLLNLFSHDMVSPFKSLLGLLNLYEGESITEGNFTTHITNIKKSTTSNVLLLQNLVKWSKSQLEGFKPSIEPVSLNELILEAVESVQGMANEKHIEIKYAPVDITCLGDQEMIKLIIRNTLSNALKFSNLNGVVELKAKRNGVKSILEIQDYGIGMTAKEIESLSGQQVNARVGTANEKGSGIGLQITQQFVRLNKGEIKLNSKPGQGTLVTLTFPLPH
jgi:signal transduction histidine kinase